MPVQGCSVFSLHSRTGLICLMMYILPSWITISSCSPRVYSPAESTCAAAHTSAECFTEPAKCERQCRLRSSQSHPKISQLAFLPSLSQIQMSINIEHDTPACMTLQRATERVHLALLCVSDRENGPTSYPRFPGLRTHCHNFSSTRHYLFAETATLLP